MGGSSAPTAYQPANQAGADAAYTNNLNMNTANNQGLWNYAMPAYQSAVGNVTNNPYNQQAQSGANATSVAGMGVGQGQIDRGNQMAGLNTGIIQAGFDPQSALKNYNYGQTINGATAGAAQSGLAGSPFGAGMVADAGNRFNMDWQAGAQGRQGQAIQQLATNNGAANASQGQGLKSMEGASLLPQQTYDNTQQQTMAALNQLVQAMSSIGQTSTANTAGYGQYLGIGQNATSIDQNAAKINNAGGGIMGGLGSLFGMASGGGGTLGGDLMSTIGLFG